MALRKTAHKRRRTHSSKRRKNVKSRKVMRGGWNNLANCQSEWRAVQFDPQLSQEWLKRNNTVFSNTMCQQLVARRK
jgi:hypothetical protein